MAGATPSEASGREGSAGTPSPPKDFLGEKRSQFFRTRQHSQPRHSVSRQPGPVTGRVSHQVGTLSPGMRVTFSIPSSKDRCYGMNHAQGLGAPHAAQAPIQPEKHILAAFFKKDSFLLQACVMGGHLSAAVAQGRALGRKQSRAGPCRAGAVTLPSSANPFQHPNPAGTATSPPSHTEKEISPQPALFTQCRAEASAAPEGLQLAQHEGDSAPVAPPASRP